MARGARLQIDLKSEDRRLERLQLVMSLDSLEVGAKVLIEGTGAYTTTYSAVGFNGFPPLETHVI